MTEDDFLANLLPWLDGELSPDQAARMDAFAAANPQAAERAQAERAFDDRVSSAMASDVGVDAGASFDALLAAAREQSAADSEGAVDAEPVADASTPVDPPPTPRASPVPVAAQAAPQILPADSPRPAPQGRLLHLFRPIVGVAAALMMAVSLGWFYCIGPFECGYVEAVEAVVESEATMSPEEVVEQVRASLSTLPEPPGARRVAEPDFVLLPYVGVVAQRRLYEADGRRFTVVASSLPNARPSFRRHRAEAGEDWWVAQEGGRNVVGFERGRTGCMVFVIGDAPESTLLDLARELRLADQ